MANKFKCWKRNKQWKKGYRFDNKDKHLMIREQTYGDGHQVDVWKSHPYKDILTRKFKKESQTKSFATKYMKKHDKC